MSPEYLRSVPARRFPHLTEKNQLLKVLGSAITSVVTVALSLPLLLAFILVLPACLSVRWLLLFLHCNRQGFRPSPGAESVLSNDGRWLGSEWRSSVIHAVLIYEAKDGVNVDHFRRLLLKRVIPLYPRLTQRLISLPISAGVRNCWLTDSKFSINEHVFSGPDFLTTEKDLQDYVSKLIGDGLPDDKPPWQIQVFQSFGTNRDTVLVLRVHQSVADGEALMRLLCCTLDDSEIAEVPEKPRLGSLVFFLNIFRACLVGPFTLLLWFLLSGEDCNLLTHRSGWTGSESVTWSASIRLSKVVRIKQVTRSTINCVLLSALAGALRKLLEKRGVKQPSDVKVVLPVNLRNQSSTSSAKTELGNKTSSMVVRLPVAMEGCIPRLWTTRKALDSKNASVDPLILYMTTTALMSIGSSAFARHLVNVLADKASLQFAFLPGPLSEICMEGQTLKGIYPIMPAQANLGISVTTITYADRVFMSVTAERSLGPVAELILEYLEEQIEMLWKQVLNRRAPGEGYTLTIYTTRKITQSQMKEITSRLHLAQKEVKQLTEGKENDRDGKLRILKTEFSELVRELKRSQSSTEAADPDPTRRPRQKNFFYATFKTPISASPKSPRKNSNASDSSPRKGGTEVGRKCHRQNNINWYTVTKSESPIKSFEQTRPKDKYDRPKECVINITEMSTIDAPKSSFKINTEYRDSSTSSNNFNSKLKSNKSTNVRMKPIRDLEMSNKAKGKRDVIPPEGSALVEEKGVGHSRQKGPNESNYDRYYVGLLKPQEDEPSHAPPQLFEFRPEEKSDESEI